MNTNQAIILNTNFQQKGQEMKKAEPVTIVIFGASGDLTKRKLMPALLQLIMDGLLAEKTTIVGFARRENLMNNFVLKLKKL